MHTVVVLLIAPLVGFDATIPPLIFGEARSAAGDPLYRVLTCGVSDATAVPTTTGYALTPEGGPELLEQADTVVIPGSTALLPRTEGRLPDDVAAAFARIPPTARVVSICTGAFVLAASARLNGRTITTHWRWADDLRRLHPQVTVDDLVLYVDDGDILTSAGLAAGIDLCLHMITTDYGGAVAAAVARYCVVPPRRDGGQAQFISHPLAVGGGDTAAVRAWIAEHLAEPLTVADLARRAHLSVRTFNRRFAQETGMSPGAWIVQRRVEYARELLETTNLGIDDIAARAGFGTGATLRAHLRRAVGMSPVAYRKRFGGVAG